MTKLVIIMILFASCGVSKPITGIVTEVEGDSVKIGKHAFRVFKDVPKVGDTVTFKPTVNRKKINSKK